MQESRVGRHRGAEPVPQLPRERGVAVGTAEIKEDRRVQDVLGAAAVHPLGELPAPLRQAEAPAGIACHHPALAQGEPTAVELPVDALGEGQDPPPDLLHVPARGDLEDDPVVLIGGERLLVAALAAQGEPAPAQAGEGLAGSGELDDPLGETVVQGGDQAGQGIGRQSLGQHGARQAPHGLRGAPQVLEAPGAPKVLGDLLDAHLLEREEVLLRDHSQQAARGHDQYVADTVTGHGERRLVGGRLGRQADDSRTHHPADGRVQVAALGVDPQQVLQGEDPRRHALRRDHHHGPDTLGVHAPERLAQREPRATGDRLPAQDVPQPAAEGAPGHPALLLAGLHDALGLLEQRGEAPGTEVLEDRAQLEERLEIGRREQVAGGLDEREVGEQDRAHGEERRQRETAPFAEGDAVRAAGPPADGGLGHHLAAAHQVEPLGGSPAGVEQDLPRRVPDPGEPLHQEVQVVRVHAVERSVAAQELEHRRGVGARQRGRPGGEGRGSHNQFQDSTAGPPRRSAPARPRTVPALTPALPPAFPGPSPRPVVPLP